MQYNQLEPLAIALVYYIVVLTMLDTEQGSHQPIQQLSYQSQDKMSFAEI